MHSDFPALVESLLRIVLGLRFLYSGVSNIMRWPHAVGTTRVVFPYAATLFGFAGIALMTVGGGGLVLGLQTQLCALMIVLFLLPTFVIHVHWRRTFPASVAELTEAMPGEGLKQKMEYIGKHAVHAHDVGWQDNLVFLVLSLYFSVRSETAWALDNILYG